MPILRQTVIVGFSLDQRFYIATMIPSHLLRNLN
jgi:hypothetical protein